MEDVIIVKKLKPVALFAKQLLRCIATCEKIPFMQVVKA
jgi:hypothetical protein